MKKIILTILLLGFVSSAWADSRGGMARVITSVGSPAKCIFPVDVYRIDGQNISSGRRQHTLSAGEHTLEARVVVDLGLCNSLKRSSNRHSIAPLVFTVEAGMDYYVGLNVDKPNRKDWKLEVWKVRGDAFDDKSN